jgi:hypothetical protein
VPCFLEWFKELVAWCGDWPLGGIINVPTAPWPVFIKPHLMDLEHVTTIEVEWFLASLRNAMGPAEFRHCLKGLWIKFHPDRWRGDLKSMGNLEQCVRWEKALITVSQAILALYDEYAR